MATAEKQLPATTKDNPSPKWLALGFTEEQWRTHTQVFFPAAKSLESIVLVATYCKARGLDLMSKPFHIVPMYDSKKGEYVDAIWPSITLYEIQAARSNAWAGTDAVKFGPTIEHVFTNPKKAIVRRIKAPEYAIATVYKFVNGQRCKFESDPIFFAEYVQKKKSGDEKGLPNQMWEDKPISQLAKCAKAAVLRMAFPELCSEPTAEEMEGGEVTIDVEATVTDAGKPVTDAGKPTSEVTSDSIASTATPTLSTEDAPTDVTPESITMSDATAANGGTDTPSTSFDLSDPNRKVTSSEVNQALSDLKGTGWNGPALTRKVGKPLVTLTVAEFAGLVAEAAHIAPPQ